MSHTPSSHNHLKSEQSISLSWCFSILIMLNAKDVPGCLQQKVDKKHYNENSHIGQTSFITSEIHVLLVLQEVYSYVKLKLNL